MKTELENQFGERAVKLCDGRTGLRGGLAVKATAPSEYGDKPVIRFTASDETLDRYDEVVSIAGWKLEPYKRNPVFQNSHKYGDILFTLGKSLLTETKDTGLMMDIEFATSINPVAQVGYQLYKGGFLNAVSVGFIPIRWENGAEGSSFRRKYLEQELLELSAVSIPANPNALQNAVKAGAVSRDNLSDLAEFLKEFCGDNASSESKARSAGSDANAEQLLQLARDVKRLLRA